MTHEELQAEIPAWIAGRLDGEKSRTVEGHLAECDDCRGIAELWAKVRPAFEGSDELTDPHPAPALLGRFAAGEPVAEPTRRHIETCLECSLIVQVHPRTAPSPVGRRGLSWLPFAAGLLVGAVGVWVALQGNQQQTWSGQPDLLLLTETHRGPGSVVEYQVRDDQPHIPVALDMPLVVQEGRAYTLSIVTAGDTVWQLPLQADVLVSQASRDVPVFLISTSAFPSGRSELRIDADGEPVLTFSLRIRK